MPESNPASCRASRSEMCIILDECLLIVTLVAEGAASLTPLMFSGALGVVYFLSFLIACILAILLAFTPTFVPCCSWLRCLTGWGVCFFYLFQFNLIGLSVYGIYDFMKPFLSSQTFHEYCTDHSLDHNLSNADCASLQGNASISIKLSNLSHFLAA